MRPMSAVDSPFEPASRSRTCIDNVRVAGGISIAFERRAGRSRVVDVRERDGYKVRFPRGTDDPQAVIINTGGGLAGGDRVHQMCSVAEGARACVTTQASERVYRAVGASLAQVDVALCVGHGARLNWMPQETIFFDQARLTRTISANVAQTAHLVIAETVIFGRTAMGERVREGLLHDTWRIQRGGRLIFVEAVKLDGEIDQLLDRKAVADRAHILATLVCISPDAEDRLERVRLALSAARCRTAASAWDGRLIVRALGSSNQMMRALLERVLPILTDAPVPRVWST